MKAYPWKGLALAALASASASLSAIPTVTHLCRPVPDSFTIDGRLAEPQWKGLDTLRLLRNNDPAGGKPSVETKVLAAWSRTRLYLAFIASSKDVQGTFTKHDDPLYDQDVVEVFFDPDGDSKNYLELEWNCLNAVLDYFFTGPQTGLDKNWAPQGMQNAVLVQGTANKASDTDTGMVVEISIPWTAIQPWSKASLPPKDGDTLALNFYRIEYGANGSAELLSWASTGVADFHRPDKFGALVFSSQPVTSLIPFARGAAERADRMGREGGKEVDSRLPRARRADGRLAPDAGRELRVFGIPVRPGKD
ncbi:MAG: hypothetical protein JWP91_3396 [Fibrobacteres bacterium]|nr:hypothetical protein [Fibrobacterota bacterium]